VAPVLGYTAAQVAAFPAFGRPRAGSDVVPRSAAAIAKPFAEATGMNFRLARRILVDKLGALYLIPGRGMVCMLNASPFGRPTGTVCAVTSRATKHGFFELQQGAGGLTVTGVAPEWARSVTMLTARHAGATARLRTVGFRLVLPDMPVVVEYMTSAGRMVRIGVG
jgi:hypothetical protein